MDLGLGRLVARIPLRPRCSKDDSRFPEDSKNDKVLCLLVTGTVNDHADLLFKPQHILLQFWMKQSEMILALKVKEKVIDFTCERKCSIAA
ncbi:hypothetical protein MUK42_26424 [Musa troglodytarum]|uniref:Uncharacterized protein n=1 Tax=Musa troglodytarum TaxID=320322 RepID=A0A9E7L6S1_9LILI|nr:hypothetical protein MUK42_26424 [Musa troglodytarum]